MKSPSRISARSPGAETGGKNVNWIGYFQKTALASDPVEGPPVIKRQVENPCVRSVYEA